MTKRIDGLQLTNLDYGANILPYLPIYTNIPLTYTPSVPLKVSYFPFRSIPKLCHLTKTGQINLVSFQALPFVHMVKRGFNNYCGSQMIHPIFTEIAKIAKRPLHETMITLEREATYTSNGYQ